MSTSLTSGRTTWIFLELPLQLGRPCRCALELNPKPPGIATLSISVCSCARTVLLQLTSAHLTFACLRMPSCNKTQKTSYLHTDFLSLLLLLLSLVLLLYLSLLLLLSILHLRPLSLLLCFFVSPLCQTVERHQLPHTRSYPSYTAGQEP